MLYVGLGIHTQHIALCVLSEIGQVAQRARVHGIGERLRLLKGLPDRRAGRDARGGRRRRGWRLTGRGSVRGPAARRGRRPGGSSRAAR
jgi:hypothetical protein